MTRLARLSLFTTLLTFALSAVGGLVRATDSGLGCPGWPKCYGRWIPPADHHAIIEMTHRYLASLVSVGVVATCVVAVLFHRRDRVAVRLGLALVPLIAAQAGLGAYVVNRELEPWVVSAHLGLGMAFAATLVALTVHLLAPRDGQAARDGTPRGTVAFLGLVAAAVYGQLLLGSYVTGRGAGLAIRGWPLHDGRLVPQALDELPRALHLAHRLVAYALAALVVVAARRAVRTWGRGSAPARFAHAAAGLVGVQIVLGALNVWTGLHAAVVTAHLTVATLIWGAAWTTFLLARRTTPADSVPLSPPAAEVVHANPSVVGEERAHAPVLTEERAHGSEGAPAEGAPVDGRPGRGERVRAFVALTKPRIIELLLVTTVPTMVVAASGVPPVDLMVWTLVGGALAAGGANAANMYLDRDIDAVMARTAGRPLVTGIVSPREAVAFAVALEVVAFVELWLLVNLVSAVLAVSATLFYVFVYTLWLKRRSTSNIVIGGAAGAVPVLVGWTAVRGRLDLAPLVLFLIIFVWTPPHFWALAIKYRDDYAAADVPMLPAVTSLARTAQRIVAYTVVLWALSLVFAPVGGMGAIYLVAAVALGGIFLLHAVRLARLQSAAQAMKLFSYSISYVTLLFSAMAADRLLLR